MWEGRVVETLLSRRPKAGSGWVALGSLAVMFLVSLGAWKDPSRFQHLAASGAAVLEQGEYWRLFSSLALHADLGHLLSNSLLFAFFSYLLYGYFGFWVYPVGILLLGALTSYLSLLTYPPQVGLVGASGAVYVMAGFWLSLYLLVERRYSPGRRLIRVVGVALVVLFPTSLEPQVSYRSHAIGLGVGVAAALLFYQVRRDEFRQAERLEWEWEEE